MWKQGHNDTFDLIRFDFDYCLSIFEYFDYYWPASPWLPALLIDQLATIFPCCWLTSWPLALRSFDWLAGHWLPALVLLIWLWFLVNAFVCLEIISSPVNAASRQMWKLYILILGLDFLCSRTWSCSSREERWAHFPISGWWSSLYLFRSTFLPEKKTLLLSQGVYFINTYHVTVFSLKQE